MAAHFVKPAAQYEKLELDDLIERLKTDDADAIYECIVFTLAESFGRWHNRARAKICRNLKNRLTDPTLRHRLVDVVIERLRSGRFSEQFKDQLTMAIRFDPDRMHSVATRLQFNGTDYIRRYAQWVLHAVESNPPMPPGGG